YKAICIVATGAAIALFLIGLWNATLLLSEKGFYIMAFLLALFSSATMQKNERDQAHIRRDVSPENIPQAMADD
ncbi:MAG: YiaA/YiaB family inner membrane protein, partial [Plesiomonas shigelloides]